MKIYAENIKDESTIMCSDVELLCSKNELDVLVNLLLTFQHEIDQYIENNKDKSNLGFTHMHYQDNNPLWKKGDSDVVIYVDLTDTRQGTVPCLDNSN